MKWTMKRTVEIETDQVEDKLASKTVLDDVLDQISGGAAMEACHRPGE